MDAAGWSPLNTDYVGATQMSGGGAFGAEYVFSHQQEPYYKGSTPAFTEFIELSIATPVYVVQLELGSSRGMGAVVSIKVRSPSGSWISLYSGAALTADHASHASMLQYWTWAPTTCRTHFLASDFRLELDTSIETGIPSWNYIDYVRVFGAGSIQSAVLQTGQTAVIYVPDEHAIGDDTFQYQSTDCPGDRFRFSEIATSSISIAPRNDVPYPAETVVQVPLGSTLVPF
eukprot:3732705-Prymnesium_polylepis.1